jgi:hypothetical protein
MQYYLSRGSTEMKRYKDIKANDLISVGESIRVTVDLPNNLYNDLSQMSTTSNDSKADILRKAIKLYKFLLDEEKLGGRVEIENSSTGKVKELKII